MRACWPGATGTRRSATAAASMPATRTATASARCTSIRWRGSGHCSAPGCVRIAASRRRSCQSISASLSSCTTRAGAEKPCSVPLSLLWSGDALHHPGSRQEPLSKPHLNFYRALARLVEQLSRFWRDESCADRAGAARSGCAVLVHGDAPRRGLAAWNAWQTYWATARAGKAIPNIFLLSLGEIVHPLSSGAAALTIPRFNDQQSDCDRTSLRAVEELSTTPAGVGRTG